MELFDETHRRAIAYWKNIANRSAFPSAEAIRGLARFREPFPETGAPDLETIARLDDAGAPATVAITGGRYFGFVMGGVLPAALSASWLASTWDQNAALHVMSPLGAALEEVTIDWILDALRLPSGCGAAYVTGATMANFTALAAARHALLAREGWNVEEQGLFGAPPITVIVGAEAHASVLKALAMLGLGRNRVTTIETDRQGRMIPESLAEIPPRSIVCLQAGNVNTGAFDPARDVIEKAHAAGAWVHVDGAFGLWARVSKAFDHLTGGYDLADSWALDNHKWLNVNYDSAIAITRRTEDLGAAFAIGGAYLLPGKGREPMYYSPELSRRARAIEVWAAMKSLGRAGLIDLIERTCAHARRFAEGLCAAGHAVLNDVVINQVLVRFGASDEETRRVIKAIQDDGTCWCGETTWHGQVAMRISVSSWRTTAQDVEDSLAAMIRCAKA
ncbi:MAG TPA: aminotransferase class V-fold PLP-dependent enzyme [Bryobacteraceae bacterium]|nr:aminotransferase class V-fold PLP-dependent enzyme [Bryobacteraceae bacterium]